MRLEKLGMARVCAALPAAAPTGGIIDGNRGDAARGLTPALASHAYKCQRPSGMTCARREAGAHRPAPSAGSPSRPDPRPWRRLARLFGFLPELALLLGALSPFAAAPVQAQAQTVTLVSNYGQTTGTSLGANQYVNAQAFTTGADPDGYPLHSIEAVIENNSQQPLNASRRAQVRAELWSATTGGVPNAKVASLAVPTGFTAGTVAFAAPMGTTLAASTTYFFLLYTTGT
ncbi:MAG: hypothetical protein OXH14_10200, partial [Alphaproteobacteria bacterium]|nr:hypothetical protein [Alphaproteobacteria bacterium]